MAGVERSPVIAPLRDSALRRAVRRFGLTGVLAFVTFAVSFLFTFGPGVERMTLPAAFAVSFVAAGAVGLSGRHPLAALVVVAVATLVQPLADVAFPAMDLVVVLVVFQAALKTSLAPWLLVVVCWAVLTVNDLWQRMTPTPMSVDATVLYPALLTALGVGLGLQSRRVRTQNQELIELREADRLRAVSDERRRIARDVHDVAAHHLSALVVRNTLARRLDTPAALRQAAEFTAETSTQTLESLRDVVRMLNTENESPRSPAPRLADLDDIITRMSAAGLDISADIGDVSPVDADLEGVVVRVVQEALANALRHAGPGRCHVEVARAGREVSVLISDEGLRNSSGENGTRPSHAIGYGLIGMRERVEARGGRFAAAPDGQGGWVVSATLPVSA